MIGTNKWLENVLNYVNESNNNAKNMKKILKKIIKKENNINKIIYLTSLLISLNKYLKINSNDKFNYNINIDNIQNIKNFNKLKKNYDYSHLFSIDENKYIDVKLNKLKYIDKDLIKNIENKILIFFNSENIYTYYQPQKGGSNYAKLLQDYNPGNNPSDPNFNTGEHSYLVGFSRPGQKVKNPETKKVGTYQHGFKTGYDQGYSSGYFEGNTKKLNLNEICSNYLKQSFKNEKMNTKLLDDYDIEDVKFKVQDEIDDIKYENELDDIYDDDILDTTEDDFIGGNNEDSSEGFIKNVKLFFTGIPKKENPKYHCKKPNKKKIKNVLLKKIDKSLREYVNINDKWNTKSFNETCSKKKLRNMKYCENDIDIGFSRKKNKFYKKCKLKKDEKSTCTIM